MVNGKHRVIVILGPTACGKTAMAVSLARRLHGAVISADSRQVYRGLDIGSGKDLEEYVTGGKPVETRLLDIADPAAGEPYSLADFMRDAKNAILELEAQGSVPILCGGTGLYLHALIRGYKLPGGPADRAFRRSVREEDRSRFAESLAGRYDLSNGEDNNLYRLSRKMEIESCRTFSPYGGPLENAEYLVLGAFRPRAEIHRRIEARLDERLAHGMIDEIRHLHDERKVSWEKLESFGLEYREVSRYVQGGVPFEEMRNHLLVKIRQFAKRQDTWFRKMQKEGVVIHWLPPDALDEAERLCHEFLNSGIRE